MSSAFRKNPFCPTGAVCFFTIYNYFDSKAALVGATVESVWGEIFRRPEDGAVFGDAQACIAWIYGQMEYGSRQYPGFFTLHSLGFLGEEKVRGQMRMQQTWQHIREELCAVLKRDARIRADAFTDLFTAERFARIVRIPMVMTEIR